jgi:hypothetical protein
MVSEITEKRREYNRAYYQANKEKYAARSIQSRKENPESCNAARRRYYARHAEQEREKRRAYYALNAEVERDKWREYRSKNAEVIKERSREPDRWRKIKERFGITRAEWEAIFHAQGGRCAICATIDPGSHWCTDHCHQDGKIRGILCHKCNLGIGHLNDDPTIIRNALAYLEGATGTYAGSTVLRVDVATRGRLTT